MAATSVVAIATRAELCVGACYSSVGPSGQCTFSVVNTTTGGIASLLWSSRASLVALLFLPGMMMAVRGTRSQMGGMHGVAVFRRCCVLSCIHRQRGVAVFGL